MVGNYGITYASWDQLEHPLNIEWFSIVNHLRLNEQELEDKIWEVTGSPITKTNVWRAVGGDKQTCLNKITQMVATSQLKEEETGKNRAVNVTRINTQKKAEFEFALTFQVNLLKTCREDWSKLNDGKFEYVGEIIHTEPPLPLPTLPKDTKTRILQKRNKNTWKLYKQGIVEFKGKKYKLVEKIPLWKIKESRKKTVDTHLERLDVYQNALLLFIARINLQRSLGLLTHSEAHRRILKTQRAIDNHMRKFLNLKPSETDALRQYIWRKVIFRIEPFMI